jgi:long-subunit acyl-CoA synthetase (AMP-forming)
MKGYYKKPRETAEAVIVDEDGQRWLRICDIGNGETANALKPS